MLGQRAPVGVAVLLDVCHEAHVLLRRPGAPVEPHLGAARRSPSPHASLAPLSPLPGSGWTMRRAEQVSRAHGSGRGRVVVYMRTRRGGRPLSGSDAAVTGDGQTQQLPGGPTLLDL